MSTLIEKLRQIANAKLGDPMPECLRAPTLIVGNVAEGERVNITLGANDWATPLSKLAGEAADALEAYERALVTAATELRRASSEHARSKP